MLVAEYTGGVVVLSSKTLVPIPSNGVIVRHTGTHRYVFKVLRTFRNAKGQPTNTRVQIGRVDEASGLLVPNDAYWVSFPDSKPASVGDSSGGGGAGVEVLPEPDSIRSAGGGFVADKICHDLGVDRLLGEALGASRASMVATVASYMLARGNVMDGLGDFCGEQLLSSAPVDGQGASEVFATISHADRMRFFRPWAQGQPDDSCYAYDVTSLSSYAEGIADTEWGYNRDGERLPQINLGCYVNQSNALPVFYLTYPGSIVDCSHLPYMMAFNQELGVDKVSFVMDQGFCSTTNLEYMAGQHLGVIVKTSLRHKSVRQAVEQVQAGITSLRYRLDQDVYARTVTGRFYGVAARLHIYHDANIAERQRRDLNRLIQTREETLAQLATITAQEAKPFRVYHKITILADGTFTYEPDWDKIDQLGANNGFFALLTTGPLDASQTLDVYRRKDLIEKTFDDLKNHLEMDRLRTHNTDTTDGKLFAAFIALIITSYLQTKLGDLMREKSWSKHTIIAELNKIRVVTTSNGTRLLNPLTKTQRDILAALGYTFDDIKNHISALTPSTTYMQQTTGI